MAKACTRCGVVKNESEFWQNARKGKSVLRARCKVCDMASHIDHSEDEKPEGKVCTACGIYKPISQFHKHKICLYGVEPKCKACKAKVRQRRRELDPGGERNNRLKTLYGITSDEYDAMADEQEGRCAICGDTDKELVVDHNHTTKKVRGLLCTYCNTMIGHGRESIDILVAGAAYLFAEMHPDYEEVAAEVSFRYRETVEH